MSRRVLVDSYEVFEERISDNPLSSRDKLSRAHVMEEKEEMRTLIRNFKDVTFPSTDEFTRIELEQDRRRKSSTERPKKGSYPSVEFTSFGMEGGDKRRRTRTKEYILGGNDEDDDNFMVLSTNEDVIGRDDITTSPHGHNILNDELKEARRNSRSREKYPITMVPICDIDYLSDQESVEKPIWRQKGLHDLTKAREFGESSSHAEHSNGISISKGNQTTTEYKSSERTVHEHSDTMFMSKSDVKDLLREFNEEYCRNTEILIKEMKESTSNLVKSFQEAVTFSFREITSTLKEMEEQNNRLSVRNNDVLSEDVELLYNKIMEDNQEIKTLIAGLKVTTVNKNVKQDTPVNKNVINETPVNKKVIYEEECTEQRWVGTQESANYFGPEEAISDVEVRVDKMSDTSHSLDDDFVCEIVVCPGTKVCVDEKLTPNKTQLKNEKSAQVKLATKSGITEVKDKLEELLKNRVVERSVNRDDEWNNIKSMHQNVHYGIQGR